MSASAGTVSLDGAGHLALRPLRTASGAWFSGRIETRRSDFAAPAGGRLRIEARLRLPDVTGAAAAGYWPAFWALGTGFRQVGATGTSGIGRYGGWPGVGEIDVVDSINGTDTVYGTLHCGTSPGGPCNESIGLGGDRRCPDGTCRSAFHDYAVELDRSVVPEQLTWSVDGVVYHRVRADQLDAATWRAATHHGFFLILDVAIGGAWPGAPTARTAPGIPMLVDRVAVSVAPGPSTASGEGAVAPSTAADGGGSPDDPATAGDRGRSEGGVGGAADGRSSAGTPAAGAAAAARATPFPRQADGRGDSAGTGAAPGASTAPGTPAGSASTSDGWAATGTAAPDHDGALGSGSAGQGSDGVPAAASTTVPSGSVPSGSAYSPPPTSAAGGDVSGSTSVSAGPGETTLPAAAEGSCRASARTVAVWPGGAQVQVTVRNLGSVSTDDWSVILALPSGWSLRHTWNASARTDGADVRLDDVGWNGPLAPGGSTASGFLVEGTGSVWRTPSVACSLS